MKKCNFKKRNTVSEFKEITKLRNNMPEKHKEKLAEFLELNTNNSHGMLELALLEITNGNLKEAKGILYSLLHGKNKSYAASTLLKLYVSIGEYGNCLALTNYLLKCDDLDENLLYECKCCLAISKVKLNFNINKDDYSKETYHLRQIIDYNELMAKNHIRKHLHENSRDKKHSVFNKININELFEIVKETIINSDKYIIKEIVDMYTIYYPNIGKVENENSNYLSVIVTRGTKDIITMYPENITIEERKHIIDVHNYSINNFEVEQELTRSLVPKKSQIDKFNERYGLK